ncbi:hypothetical protein M9H77_28466 [Catharanthus roseus]|uniref:Uncharacterized protein n=1 Tax=Catharanthus roseus TaxID=4058 RepID=A0ACC0AI49_CATRO|nr:hypothetical protein M9H77_28466 [Catharanthus roseus]
MADVVQYKLERMLDVLEDLDRRGLFNRREISEIVKQRRKFEYRLKRPSPLKEDFLVYIDYEKKAELVRLLRKKAFLKQQTGKKKKWKNSVSDFAGVSRIVEIYRLATNRFKVDIQLWFQYLEFCRQRSNGRMKKALAQLIRFHPSVPGVWIYAAALEFDHNLNAVAARSLIRYVGYLNKLKARKVALGEDEGTLVRNIQDDDEKQWRDENRDLFMTLNEKTEEDKASDVQDSESKENLDLFREQGLSILQTVYNGAIAGIPSSFSLRTRFLEILEATDLANSDEMRKQIIADLERDFSKEPEYWDWLARHESLVQKSRQTMAEEISADHLSKAIKVYEDGLKAVPSTKIFYLYTKFLMDAIKKNGDGKGSEHLSDHGQTLETISQMLKIYEKAESTRCISEDLACHHVSFLLQLGKLDDAKVLVEKRCTKVFSNSVQLWALWLSIELRCIQDQAHCPRKANLSPTFDLLQDVLNKVAVSEAESLWYMALKCFGHQRHYFDKLIETSMVSLTKFGGTDDGFSLSSGIINIILERDGVQSAREMYRRYLGLPHLGLVLYRNCIELESNLACAGNIDGLVNARKLYDSALTTYDQDVNLWRNYYLMEVKLFIDVVVSRFYDIQNPHYIFEISTTTISLHSWPLWFYDPFAGLVY